MESLGQKLRILEDLLLGINVDMLSNLMRYGTSCRSRISELRAMGFEIDDFVPKGERYKIYFIKEENIEASKELAKKLKILEEGR